MCLKSSGCYGYKVLFWLFVGLGLVSLVGCARTKTSKTHVPPVQVQKPLIEQPRYLARNIELPSSLFDHLGGDSRYSSKYYRLSLSRKSKVEIKLIDSKRDAADIDVYLEDKSARKISSSTKLNQTELISSVLGPGVYYIKVYSYNKKNGSYMLVVNSKDLFIPRTSINNANEDGQVPLRESKKYEKLEKGTIWSAINFSGNRGIRGIVGRRAKKENIVYKIVLNDNVYLRLLLNTKGEGRNTNMELWNFYGAAIESSGGSRSRKQIEKQYVNLSPGKYYVNIFVVDKDQTSEFSLEKIVRKDPGFSVERLRND